MWKGLVMDESASHFKKMGSTLWLYFYLIVNANRSTGVVMRKVKTVALDMGIPRSTIFRWLKNLREAGYIETHSSGHSLTIKVSKWRPIGVVPNLGQEKSQSWDARSLKNWTSQKPSGVRIMAKVKEESNQAPSPKKNIFKENNLKSDIAIKNLKGSELMAFKTKEELLAHDLAHALDDLPGFPLYLTLARKYPESYLRETLGRVREIPTGEIKTGRGALFNFLIQKCEIKSTFDPRH